MMQFLKSFFLMAFLLPSFLLAVDEDVSSAETVTSSFNESSDDASADEGSCSSDELLQDKKPAVEVHVYDPISQNKYADGLLYWHLSDPKLLAQAKEETREKTWNKKKYPFSVQRSNMLEELPAFLSRKALHPKVYVITGMMTGEDGSRLYAALRMSYFDRLQVEGDKWKFQRSRDWQHFWAESGGMLVLSFYGFPEDVSPDVRAVKVDDVHSGKTVHVGNMMTIRIKLDKKRTANLLVYYTNDFNLAALKRRGFDVGFPAIERHPAVIGLEQALNRARESFSGSSDPLIVASNINIPLFPCEPNGLASHLDNTLRLDIRVSPISSHGNFNAMKNTLSSYTLETQGHVDYLNVSSTSELLDFVGLDKQYGDSRNKMTMQVVEFTSTCRYSFPVNKTCGPGQKLVRQRYLNSARASSDVLAAMGEEMVNASEKVISEYSIDTVSGHYPIYADLVIPEHQMIAPDALCQAYAYPVLDLPAFKEGEAVAPDASGKVTIQTDIDTVNEILRFARDILPNDSGVYIMMDPQQRIYAVPYRSGEKSCQHDKWMKLSGDAGLGKLEKTTRGFIHLSDMRLRGQDVSLWKTLTGITGINPNRYATNFIRSTTIESDHHTSDEVNGRRYNYKFYRMSYKKKPAN